MEGPEVDIIEKMKIAREKDKEVVRIVEEMKKAKVKVLQGNEWCYDSEPLEWGQEVTLQCGNTRKLDGELCTGQSTFIY